MKKFICNGDKYWISVRNTVALPVAINNLPNEVLIEGEKLVVKTEFHVSLVCINEIIKKHRILISNFADLIVADFCDFTDSNEINFISFNNEFKFAEEKDLKTIVVMCEVSNLKNFFDFVNKKYGLNIEYPPTHITLYTLPEKLGIYLIDLEDIKNLTKPIPNLIGHLL
jgi:hypothetical protein